ncbi:uncharacterized protein LOC142180966 [Nicotiana tabacum]|uniref:Uncharacterized protein LOC142180966 n=1 Tax=Nicotiana tabacum TaxID=4097 RepID=A0AC58UIX9_TOBAC
MLIVFSVKNKLYFIQPDCERPPPNSAFSRQCDMCNNIVISWIHNLLSPVIRKNVLHCQLAKDVWMELEDRYGHPSGIRVYQVKKEPTSISQGSISVPEYYARMKSVWDELSILTVHTDSYWTYGGGRLDIQKCEENQRFYQFLMGLNDSYANARINLVMMSSFPTINKAYSLLVNDERQRKIQPSPSHFSSESASFSVGSQRSTFHPKTTFDPRRPNV